MGWELTSLLESIFKVTHASWFVSGAWNLVFVAESACASGIHGSFVMGVPRSVSRHMENDSAKISESDEVLLQRAGKGDERAFAEIYDRFSSRLFGLAFRILGNEHDAGDALQEGFVYLWEKASEFDAGKSRAFTWAVMIFRNKAIDRARSRRRRQQLNETAAKEMLPLAEHNNVERADHAADLAERAYLVRQAMDELPKEQRRCIEWAFLKGYTHHQLAEYLEEPLGTVKTNIRRGLLRLRNLLNGGAP